MKVEKNTGLGKVVVVVVEMVVIEMVVVLIFPIKVAEHHRIFLSFDRLS